MKTMIKLTSLILCAALIFSGACLFSTARGGFTVGEFSGFGELYDTVVSGLENGVPGQDGKITIDVSGLGLNTENIQEFSNAVKNHNPQFFWWAGSFAYSYYSDGTITRISATCTYTGDELAGKKARYLELLAPLYALHHDGWSNLETVIFYSDYIAANYQYDLTYTVRDAYGILDTGAGVCQAYTMLFMQLMNHFDIPCTYAQSDHINHIWNVVYVDGAWYHIDVTHNDPTYDRPGKAAHECTLTGSATTQVIKSDFAQSLTPPATFDDMTLGLTITVSENDHPVRALLLSSEAPTTWYKDGFYSILPYDSAYALAKLDLAQRTLEKKRTLSDAWRVPNGSGYYYPGNYSSLVSDGDYLYYYDEEKLYADDPEIAGPIALLDVGTETDIYGMQFKNGTLTYYTGVTPSDETYAQHVFDASFGVYDKVVVGEFEGKNTASVVGTIKGLMGVNIERYVQGIELTVSFSGGNLTQPNVKTATVSSAYSTVKGVASIVQLTAASGGIELIPDMDERTDYIFALRVVGIPAGQYTAEVTINVPDVGYSSAPVSISFEVT